MTNYAFAQEDKLYIPSKVIPPSPTAASLGVYGDMPVSYYTGTPNISIPLYTIQTNNHTLGINMQYNATAVRVAQDASWVGLGWSLNAGGVITRSIRGLDDFSFNGNGYYNSPSLPTSTETNDYYYASMMEHAPDHDYFEGMLDQRYDGDPDIFYYSFGSYSGKFLIGKKVDGSPVLVAEKNSLKIEFIDTGYGSWKIKTPDGYEYIFGTVETTEDYYTGYPLTEANLKGLEPRFTRSYNESASAWYLDEIKAPNGEAISFVYKKPVQSMSIINRYQHRYDLLEPYADAQTYSDDQDLSLQNKYTYNSASRQVINDVYLDSIKFKNGCIAFHTVDRLDIEPHPFESGKPQRLTNIMVYDNTNSRIREFVLDQGYFNEAYPINQNYSHKRLKLNSITEYGENGVGKSPHLFTYYDPNNMPGKYSNKVDLWGFYNPSVTTPILEGETVPTLLPPVETDTWIGRKLFEGANRKPDKTGDFTKKGVINEIKYPTGGKTVFDFEPNQYYHFPAETEIVKTPVASVVSKGDGGVGDELMDVFEIEAETSLTFSLNGYETYGGVVGADQAIGFLKRSKDNSIIKTFTLTTNSAEIVLEQDNYYLQVEQIPDFNIYLTCYTTEIKENYNKNGGGLRIKSIVNVDENGAEITNKRFIYTRDGSEEGLSSGVLLDKQLSFYKRQVTLSVWWEGSLEATWINNAWGLYLVRASSSTFPLGFTSQSSSVSYGRVYVLEGENGESGSTRYDFYISATPDDAHNYDSNDLIPELPYPQNTKNGKLKEVEVIDRNGQPVEKTEYNYTEKASSLIKGVKIFKSRPDPSPLFQYDDGDVKYYDNLSKWWVLTSKVTTKFLGERVIELFEEYNFDNPEHKQITSQLIVTSDGSVIKTTFKYPHDFAETAPYTEMINRHIISPIIEEATFKGEEHLQSRKTNYAVWGPKIIAPEIVSSKNGDGDYESRVRYLSYDEDNGNILSAAKEGDQVVSYIWGYDKTYPVAQVLHADDDQIAYASFETAEEKGGWVYSNYNFKGTARTGEYFQRLYGHPVSRNLVSGKYKLEYWAKGSVSVSGVPKTSIAASEGADGWTLYEWELDINASSTVTITGSAATDYLDELRLYPVGAHMTTYTFEPLIGLTSVTDQNHITTYYEYDDFGRLNAVKDNKKHYLQQNIYHYKQ